MIKERLQVVLNETTDPIKNFYLSQVPETVSKVLTSQFERFSTRCNTDIYPGLSGTKYNTLATYYTLLNDNVNLKAVSKIRAAIPGLDYKDFLAAEDSDKQLQLLKPLLNNGNLQ